MIAAIGLFLFVAGYMLRICCDLRTPYWLLVVVTGLLFCGTSMLTASAMILCVRYLP